MKESALEREFDYFGRIFHLPACVKEYPFAESVGRRFRFDRAWPIERVAVELDGGAFSGGRHVRGKGFMSDCRKMNLAVMLGWRVLRFTRQQLEENPARCIEEIQVLLKGNGR